MNFLCKYVQILAIAIGCIIIPLFKLEAETNHFNFNFSKNNQGWQGDFADYPINVESFFELGWGWTTLPKEISTREGITLTKGMFLTGNNHSDDLFMFIKRQITGLVPNATYDLTFNVIIENNVLPGQFGVGGAPGESVYFKVGASKIEPKKVNVNGFYLLNIDKGDQSEGGKNAIVVGNLANPLVDPLNSPFEPKIFTNEIPLKVNTNSKGEAWLLVGTDSAFEGLTVYYIASISVYAELSHNSND